MPSVRNVKYTIGKEASNAPGTPVARDAVIPISDIGSLDRSFTKESDPVIVGSGMKADDYVSAADAKGSLPISPRSCPGWGRVVRGALGLEALSGNVIGVVRLRYKGASASCKITTSLAGKTIQAAVGALGAESADATFGTAGSVDLTAAGNDTLAELVAAIAGYADYEAVLVSGLGASSIASVVQGTFQAKGKFVFLILTGAASGVYAHRITPDLVVDSQRPTYSIQKDGFGDNYLYAGNVFNVLSLSAQIKGAVEATADILAMTETAGQEASALSLGTAKPYIFAYGLSIIGANLYNYCRKHSLKIDGGHLADGYGQASLDRAYQAKGTLGVTGDMTLRHDTVSHLERAKVEVGTRAPISLVYFASEQKKVANGVAEMMIVEIPYAKIQKFEDQKNGDMMDAQISFEGFYPGDAAYDPAIVITIISSDSAEY